MMLSEWCRKWNVSYQAEQELRAMMGVIPAPLVGKVGEDESAVQSRVRLAVAQLGQGLWRNNVGALKDGGGRYVRYGLANESAKMNESIKSADLIGLRPITIESRHVGHVIGQFLSYETKPEGWRFTGTEREIAQLKWAQIINSLGGHAKFTTGVHEL